MNKKIFLSALLACGLGAGAWAQTNIYVSAGSGNDDYNGASWETAFKTLKKAVESVKAGEETVMYLEPGGTFDTGGMITFGEGLQLTIVGNNTTIQAATQPGKDGGEGARIFRIKGDRVTVKGITFQNGRQIEYYGGGALFNDVGTLEVDSCIFLNNEAGSGGGAIATRCEHLIVRNSYFEGNYCIGGGAMGAAINCAGIKGGAEGNSIVVENCTFYQNDLQAGGQGSAIAFYDNSNDQKYTNITSARIVNCTFLNNSTTTPYQGAIDMANNDATRLELVNNTFYGQDGALQVGDIYGEDGGAVIMLNNLIFGDKAGIFGMQNYTVADLRDPIVAYNNIVIGKEGNKGVNEYIDDPCFNEDKDACNNVVELLANYPLSNVALATSLSRDNFVPYLPLTAANSNAVDKGYTGDEYADLIPATDVRGVAAAGTRDIGAYEYAGASGIFAPRAEVADFFALTQSAGVVTVVNTADRALSLNVLDATGRTVYTGVVDGTLSLTRQQVGSDFAVFVLSDGASTQACKVVMR